MPIRNIRLLFFIVLLIGGLATSCSTNNIDERRTYALQVQESVEIVIEDLEAFIALEDRLHQEDLSSLLISTTRRTQFLRQGHQVADLIRTDADTALNDVSELVVPEGCRELHRTAVRWLQLVAGGSDLLAFQLKLAVEIGALGFDLGEYDRAIGLLDEATLMNIDLQYHFEDCAN